MNKGIIIGGVIILAGAASAPYFLGSAIEKKFNDEINHLKTSLPQLDPRLGLKQSSYKRGWFSSTSKIIFTINGNDLPVENKITHGPFGFFGLGKIESSFILEGKDKQKAENLFAGKAPLLITTKFGFFNNYAIDFYSAKIDNKPLPDDPSIIVNWGGLKATITVNNNQASIDLNAPNLTVTNNNSVFDMKNLTVVSKGGYAPTITKMASINWAGVAELNIEKLSASKNQDIFGSTVNLLVNMSDDETVIGYNTTLKLTNLTVPQELGFKIADNNLIEFGLNFNGIPKKPLIDFLTKIEDIQKQGKEPTESEIMTMGEGFAVAYLQGTPSITANALIQDDQKNARISAEAKLITPDTSASNIMELAINGTNRLEITVAPSFSESLLNEVEEQLPISKEEFIQGITDKNRFILKDNEFLGKFEFKKGQLYSNGQLDPELQKNLPYLLQGIF